MELIQRCLAGDKEFPIEERVTRCDCGEGLEYVIEGEVDFLGIITNKDSMWRYEQLMPIDATRVITVGEGNTPIIHLEDLSKKLGIEIYAKLESTNPTGTFKDREASFVVSKSLQVGDDNLVMQSTGNTAVAISYYAGLAGLSSYIFVPLLSKYKLKTPGQKEQNKIILVDGTPLQVKQYAEAFSKQFNFPKISPFHERCECNVTQAYEVFEQVLKGNIPNPDFYIQIISAGMGPIGFYYGAERITTWHPDKAKMPRIVAVQNEEFTPMNKALLEGRPELGEEGKTPDYPTKDPFEPTLHTTNAIAYYPYIKKSIENSNGLFPVVGSTETLENADDIRTSLANRGYLLADTEKASLIGYAGLVQLVKDGSIPKGSNVLLMITGKGAHVTDPVVPDAIIKPDYDVHKLHDQLKSNQKVIQDGI